MAANSGSRQLIRIMDMIKKRIIEKQRQLLDDPLLNYLYKMKNFIITHFIPNILVTKKEVKFIYDKNTQSKLDKIDKDISDRIKEIGNKEN